MTASDALKEKFMERCVEALRAEFGGINDRHDQRAVNAVLKVIAADMESAIAAKGHHMSAPLVWRLEVSA